MDTSALARREPASHSEYRPVSGTTNASSTPEDRAGSTAIGPARGTAAIARAPLAMRRTSAHRGYGSGAVRIAERKVRSDGRSLPTARCQTSYQRPCQRSCVRCGRPAGDWRATQHERAVDEHVRERELVEIGGLASLRERPVRLPNQPAAELGRPFRVETAEEVPHAVRLILGHQCRPLAGEPIADLFKLRELPVRREGDTVVRERVRPQHAERDAAPRRGRGQRPETREDQRTADQGGKEDSGRRGRERFPVHPRRADRCEQCGSARARSSDTRAAATRDAARRRQRRPRRGLRRAQQGLASARTGPDWTRKSLVGQIPAIWSGSRGRARLPSSSWLRSTSSPRSRNSWASPIAGSARTTVSNATPAARAMPALHASIAPSTAAAASQARPPRLSTRSQCGRGSRDWERTTHSGSGLPCSQGAAGRDEAGSGDLLHAAPLPVGVEQSRLSSHDGDEGCGPDAPHERPRQRVQRQGEQRGDEGDVRLEHPRDVLAHELGADPERQEGTDWVAAAEVRREGGLVARRREAVEAPPQLQCPVGEGEPGRGVVEADVSGELASPEASTGSPYAKKTHPAAASAARPERLTRCGRQDAASPAAASPTTTGSARRAVPGIQVRKPAATTITAYPRGSRSSGPARSPASRATSAPHPRHSAPRASGKTSQGTRRLTRAAQAHRRPSRVDPAGSLRGAEDPGLDDHDRVRHEGDDRVSRDRP